MCLNHLQRLFNDQRVVVALIGVWTIICCAVFLNIMLIDESPFLAIGPNTKTRLFNVPLDTWPKWWFVAVYTFVSTCIAAFASDSVAPFIVNTMQDHKTRYIPYTKSTCLLIIQVWTTYVVIMGTIGLFVALTQIDFLLIRLLADLFINFITTAYFLHEKVFDVVMYRQWERDQGCVRTQAYEDEMLDVLVQDGTGTDCGASAKSGTTLLRPIHAPPQDAL